MTHTPEQLALARRVYVDCIRRSIPEPDWNTAFADTILSGKCDDEHGVQIALVAIIATQDANARVADGRANSALRVIGSNKNKWRAGEAKAIAAAIRAGNQYGGG